LRRVILLALLTTSTIGCGVSGYRQSSPTPASSFSTTAPVAAPLTGYAWDQAAHGLRPIVGVTGASFVSAPIFSDERYVVAFTSFASGYALLKDVKNNILLVALPSGTPALVSGPMSAEQQIAISPLGRAALIYAADKSTALLLQGMPSALRTKRINLARTANSAAVSDSGLIVTATDQADGSSLLNAQGENSTYFPVVSVGQLGGLAFLPHSSSALIADRAQSAVLLATALDSSPKITRVASAAEGVASPLAIASSFDGHWAILANRQGSIVRIDLSMQSHSESIDCSCSPSTLLPIAGNGVFRLTELGNGPLRVVDGDSAKLRVVFVGDVQKSNAPVAERVK
jgi:hypothetical protein